MSGRKLPRLCIHSGTQRYYIKIQGRRIYLGKVGGPEAEQRAEAERLRILRELATGAPARPPAAAEVTVNVLLVAYMEHVDEYYRLPDGQPSGEVVQIDLAIKPLQRLHGSTPVTEFGPLCLEAVQRAMIDHSWKNELERAQAKKTGWCRKLINAQVNRIRRLFKWGVSRGLVPAEVHHALTTLAPLRRHRSAARETAEVPPAPEAAVEAVRARVSPTVRAMIDLQLLTGARPGEVCRLRGRDIDRTGALVSELLGVPFDGVGRVWAYLPGYTSGGSTAAPSQRHKTAHHGHIRIVPIGPRAQELLAPWLAGLDPEEYVFSPARAAAARQALRRQARQTPRYLSQLQRGARPAPKRQPGPRYLISSYAHAIEQACLGRPARPKKRGRAALPEIPAVPHWHPHQLRHNATTRLQREFGWEVARVVCGHKSLSTTQIYVVDDLAAAFKAMELRG
jgi:integrase